MGKRGNKPKFAAATRRHTEKELLALKNIKLPPKTRCAVCSRLKSVESYSNKKQEDLRKAIFWGKDDPRVTCRDCASNSADVERACSSCHIIKGLDGFSKAQRSNGDNARCLECVANDEMLDPIEADAIKRVYEQTGDTDSDDSDDGFYSTTYSGAYSYGEGSLTNQYEESSAAGTMHSQSKPASAATGKANFKGNDSTKVKTYMPYVAKEKTPAQMKNISAWQAFAKKSENEDRTALGSVSSNVKSNQSVPTGRLIDDSTSTVAPSAVGSDDDDYDDDEESVYSEAETIMSYNTKQRNRQLEKAMRSAFAKPEKPKQSFIQPPKYNAGKNVKYKEDSSDDDDDDEISVLNP